jgi:hypothetical protein
MRFAVYFESQPDGWSVRRDNILARLASDWPDAKLLPPEYQNVTEMGETGWEYAEGEQQIEVWYAGSGVGLTLEGDDEDLVLRFVAWFRGLVRDETSVEFCDASYAFHFPIPAGATLDDVRRLWLEN